jgi:hypothetical protein
MTHIISQLNPHSRTQLTDDEYWEECQNLSVEIEDAISIFHTHEEINRLALESPAVLKAINADALFWKVTSSSLQTALLIILARIFDISPGAKSIHKFLNATLSQPELFSRESLRRRRMKGITEEPSWLREFLDGTWAPNGPGDLRYLKKQLAPYATKFNEVYRPIRNAAIAHRAIVKTDLYELFQLTNRREVGDILDFARDLVDSVIELFSNGRKPEVGSRAEHYERRNQIIRDSTKNVITKITPGAKIP